VSTKVVAGCELVGNVLVIDRSIVANGPELVADDATKMLNNGVNVVSVEIEMGPVLPNPPLAVATNWDPPAEEVTEDQFVIGALVLRPRLRRNWLSQSEQTHERCHWEPCNYFHNLPPRKCCGGRGSSGSALRFGGTASRQTHVSIPRTEELFRPSIARRPEPASSSKLEIGHFVPR